MNLQEGKIENPNLGFQTNEEEEIEINLVDLAFALLEKVQYIAFFFLLGALLCNAYSFFFMAPQYESTAKMYVVSASEDSVVDLNDLNLGASLTADYEELMLSYPVLDQVIEKLDLDMNFEKLAKMYDIKNPEDTRILSITATSDDPEFSRDLANAMMEVSISYLPETMGTEQPNVAQEARTALRKSSPSYMKYTLLGGLIGALLCCAYVIFRYLMDDTIHTSDDMEKYFGIVPLTVIPDIEALEQNKRNERKFAWRKNKS